MGSYSHSSSEESPIAKQQGKIVQKREKLFESWYLPEAQKVMEGFDPRSESGSAAMSLNANDINKSFASEQRQTNQMLAQQNLLGTGAGAAMTAANNRARAGALADAYANSMATSNSNKASLLGTLSTMVPSPTNAVPILNNSSSRSVM